MTDIKHWIKGIESLDPPDVLEHGRSLAMPPANERGRRIVTILVAGAIALSAIAFAVVALKPTGSSLVPIRPPEARVPFLSLWPQRSIELGPAFGPKVGLVQRRAAEGEPNATWQLSPAQVATRFATEVLRWPTVTVVSTVSSANGSVVVSVGQTCAQVSVEGQPVPSPTECVLTTHQVTLAQPGVQGSGGIWEVVEVRPTSATEFVLGVRPGQTLRAGQTLTFDFRDVPPGVVGLTAFIGCGTPLLQVSGTIAVDPNHSIGTLQLPAAFSSFGLGCISGPSNGYLYAWSGWPPKPGEVGDPFSAASAIGEISIVPVSLSNSGG